MRMTLAVLVISLMPSLVVADDRAGSLDALFSRYNELTQFNGAVLVAENGKKLLHRGYGFSDQQAGESNKADTQFFVGSISKSFTADLVFQFVDEGLLGLDDPITDHLPYYRGDTGSQITVQHLLSHTDGLLNYTDNPKFWQRYDGEPLSTKEFVLAYCSSDLQFAPGSKYRYGNTSYTILGAIVEEISGKPFAKLLQNHIFEPVGMPNSGDATADPPGDLLAKGYQIGPDGFRLADPVYHPLIAAAGVYTTADDLFTYLNSIDKTALSETQLSASADGTFTYGWSIADLPLRSSDAAVRVLSTNGEINGYNALLIWVFDARQAVILLNNTGEADLVAMAANAIEVLNGGTPLQPTLRTRDRFYQELQDEGVDAAIHYYREQRDVDPDDYIYRPWPLRILAAQLLEDGRREDAIEMLRLNLETHPNDVRSKQMFDSLID